MLEILFGLVAVAVGGIALLVAASVLGMLYSVPEQLVYAALNGLRILFNKRSKRKAEKARIAECSSRPDRD